MCLFLEKYIHVCNKENRNETGWEQLGWKVYMQLGGGGAHWGNMRL